mgnify:CR=1 FL=1
MEKSNQIHPLQIETVVLNESVKDNLDGGKNLAGEYDVKRVKCNTGEIIFNVNAIDHRGENITRKKEVDPNDPEIPNSLITFLGSNGQEIN